jgi:hypothetical protein
MYWGASPERRWQTWQLLDRRLPKGDPWLAGRSASVRWKPACGDHSCLDCPIPSLNWCGGAYPCMEEPSFFPCASEYAKAMRNRLPIRTHHVTLPLTCVFLAIFRGASCPIPGPFPTIPENHRFSEGSLRFYHTVPTSQLGSLRRTTDGEMPTVAR